MDSTSLLIPDGSDGVLTCGDCLELLRELPDDSVDLVFCSPPYEDARLYAELKYKIKGQAWVDWTVERYLECVRVCKGLVCFVVEGKTRKFQWSTTPALLMADLHRAGVRLRKPAVFHRVGISGSGGPEWLRNDWEPIVCSSKGRLPWADNVAMGHPPKYKPGGKMSHRKQDGSRIGKCAEGAVAPKTIAFLEGKMPPGSKLHTKQTANGQRVQCYVPPEKANPGNVIHCSVGGGRMGSPLAHDNEAAFPESLVEFFVRSFCPPGGIVLDPFSGSGTTVKVSKKFGRRYIGFDLRESQINLSTRRLEETTFGEALSK